jgi:transposase
MDLHANAALSWSGRRALARRVVDEGWTLRAAAEAAGVSVRCARKWVGRYRDGDRRLHDRSSAPRRVANRTPSDRIAVIVLLRQLRMTAAEIAETLQMPTNGKAERFIRTLTNGWAYGAIYRSSTERAAALNGWLWYYNHRRRHSALGRQPPVSRTNLLGSYS